MQQILSVIILAVALTGCMPVVSDVTRFHDPDNLQPIGTFVVIPYGEQIGSLEYKHYASLISSKLAEYGIEEVGNKDGADYAVLFSYGIDNGETVTGSIPIWGQKGGGTTFHSGTVNALGGGMASYSGTSYAAPEYGIVGATNYSQTVYNRFLDLDIVDLKNSKKNEPAVVFEGKVRSKGKTGSFTAVSECLISALFKEFPGDNGGTERVEMMSEECMKQ